MTELEAQFQAAAQQAQQLPARPDNETLLQLYALYKQATVGDADGKRPGRFDLVGRAKYDAWSNLTGLSRTDAMQRYVDLVDRLA
ncbi:MAG: acyl-CoA-binding protein [Caldilineaceae bacterium]|nr:acyl-CoA-binding protein [Caldilineaceae bacterium]